jgi:diguanylate cyclase (GGDEF)-like protein/PAS domain S-box-containing protein
MKLKHKMILIFMTVSLIPMLAIAYLGYDYISNESRANIDRYLDAKNDEAYQYIDNWLRENSNVITNLGQYLDSIGDQDNVTPEQLRIYGDCPDITDIYVGYEDKRFISAIGWEPPAGYDPTIRPWYVDMKNAGALTFSRPYIDLETYRYVISVGQPLRNNNGEVVGVLGEDLLLDTIIQKIKSIRLENGGYWVLLDHDGLALYHPSKKYQNTNLAETPATKEIVQSLLSEKNGRIGYTLDGEKKITVFREIPSTGWILAAVILEDSVYQSNLNLMHKYIGLIIVGAVLILLFILLFSISLTKRISLLTSEAKKLSDGNFSSRLIIESHDEVADLASSFITMSDNLSKTISALQKSEEKYRGLVENSNDYIYSMDIESRITAANGKLAKHFRKDPSELIGMKAEDLLDDDSGRQLFRVLNEKAISNKTVINEQYENILVNGKPLSIDITFSPIYSDANKREIIGILATIRDISKIKNYERVVHRLAYYDAVTDLPNRIMLMESLEQLGHLCDACGTKFAVIMINLDDFKKVNDTLGRHTGDEILREIAENLRAYVEPSNLVSNVGGNEFIVILKDVNSREEVEQAASNIFGVIRKAYLIHNSEIFLTASMGVTIYPDYSNKVSEILENADAAVYRAKKTGKNHYQFFNEEMKQILRDQLDMESRMSNAIQRQEFLLHYQPIIRTDTNEVRGFEALLRWRGLEGNLISPMEFIPLAEETGMINEIGEWVLDQACTTILRWNELFGKEFVISVNISPIQLKSKGFIPKLKTIIERTGIPPELLELEITEGILIDSMERAAAILADLSKLGIKLSLDDFGTGYSSLNYLKNLSFDTLKIDKSFIGDITEDRCAASITGPIISLAEWLDLETIAEGVETVDQLGCLGHHGCKYVQGYLLARPMPEDAVLEWLRSRN